MTITTLQFNIGIICRGLETFCNSPRVDEFSFSFTGKIVFLFISLYVYFPRVS